MQFLYRLCSFVITFVLIGSPDIHASVPAKVDLHKVMAAKLKSYKTFSDIAADVKQASPEYGRKLENYLKEKKFLEEKLPPISIDGREIVIDAERNIRFKISQTQEITLLWGKKETRIPASMSFEELIDEIESSSQRRSASVLSLFISEAHALPFGVLLVGMVVGAIGTVLIVNGENISFAVELKERCERGDEATIEDLVETYNGIADRRRSSCGPRSINDLCILLSEAHICFRRRIDEIRAVNNANRSSGKEIQYEQTGDRYRVAPRTSPQ